MLKQVLSVFLACLTVVSLVCGCTLKPSTSSDPSVLDSSFIDTPVWDVESSSSEVYSSEYVTSFVAETSSVGGSSSQSAVDISDTQQSAPQQTVSGQMSSENTASEQEQATVKAVDASNFAYDASFTPNEEITPTRYFMFGVAEREVAETTFQDIKNRYGSITNPDAKYMVAVGISGPLMVGTTAEEIKACVNTGFDLAEKYNIAVSFQMDDYMGLGYEKVVNGKNVGSGYGSMTGMMEWMQFPSGDEMPTPAKLWFNWGSWMTLPGLVCFNSPAFRDFMESQMETMTAFLKERYTKLKNENKEYLFAGISMGWETCVQDYTWLKGQRIISINTKRLMKEMDKGKAGYHALYNLGITSNMQLGQLAKENGQTMNAYRDKLLNDIQREYTAWLCKQVYDIGIPRNKIFTHIVPIDTLKASDNDNGAPYVSCAVNKYSIPGFTMYPDGYDLTIMKDKIKKEDPSQKYIAEAEGYARGRKDTLENAEKNFNELESAGCLFFSFYGYNDPTPDDPNGYQVPDDPTAPINVAIMKRLKMSK